MKAIITGSTGMVGEGVLHECLNHPAIDNILVINRRSCNVNNSKLKEIIHQDFSNFSSIKNELVGYNAAFLCMGVSSIGMKEDKYKFLTYDLTMSLAKLLAKLNSDFTLIYVSGAGTDSSEQGRSMWARIKGKTENDLIKMSFKNVYAFRPGGITPTPGLKNTFTILKLMNPVLPLLRRLLPKMICSLREVGIAMINVAIYGYDKNVIEVTDIVKLSSKNSSD